MELRFLAMGSLDEPSRSVLAGAPAGRRQPVLAEADGRVDPAEIATIERYAARLGVDMTAARRRAETGVDG